MKATGFELVDPEQTCPSTRLPTEDGAPHHPRARIHRASRRKRSRHEHEELASESASQHRARRSEGEGSAADSAAPVPVAGSVRCDRGRRFEGPGERSERRHPALATRATKLFGVKYPIVQTGMGWVSGARLTAATSAAGGLGILAAATMTLDELEDAIRAVRERTDRPFGVNMRADQAEASRRRPISSSAHKVKVASFARPPKRELIKRLKDGGVRHHADDRRAAPRRRRWPKWGVDAVIAQGHEGGGHTGSDADLAAPAGARASAIDIPVLGAGGFNSGRGLVAALAYGAAGIAMGTRFLLTKESTGPRRTSRRAYLKAGLTDTVVTHAIDGAPAARDPHRRHRPAREREPAPAPAARALQRARLPPPHQDLARRLRQEGLAMRKSRELTWSQLAMAANAPMLTRASMVDGKLEVGILPTGQVVGVIDELPTVARCS